MNKPMLPILLALALAPLQAEPMPLSLDDAVDLAAAASLELYGQELALDSARRSLENSWNLFLPSLSAGMTAKMSDRLLTQDIIGSSTPGFGTTVILGTTLSLKTGVLFDLKERRTEYRSAGLGELESQARLARDVAKAYFMLVSLELDLDNKAKAINLAEERKRLAEFRFKNGIGPELDVLRAQMSEMNARSAREKAAAELSKRESAFRRQLGLAADAPLRLSTTLEVPAGVYPGAYDKLIDGRIDLEKARLAMEVAANATKRSVAVSRLPLASLDAGWNFSLPDFSLPRDAYTLSASLTFKADAWIPNSVNDLALRSLKETETRLAIAYEQARRNALDEVASLGIDIEYTRNSLIVAEGQVRLAESIYEGTRAAWERAAATALELEEAQYAVDSARQALIAGRYQYLSLLIDLGYALNVDWRTLLGK